MEKNVNVRKQRKKEIDKKRKFINKMHSYEQESRKARKQI